MKLSSDRTDIDPEINLISLIDVLFCLIIFLVVTTTFQHRSTIKLKLPQAGIAATNEAAAPLTITIDAEGHYFVGQNEVLQRDPDSLRAAIARVAGPGRDLPVVLSADGRTPHQAVVTALEALGGLGFERVSIATTPAKQP
jgi:biopolymer transport protein ExbD